MKSSAETYYVSLSLSLSIIRFVSVNVFTSPWIPLWALSVCYYHLIQLPEDDASEKQKRRLQKLSKKSVRVRSVDFSEHSGDSVRFDYAYECTHIHIAYKEISREFRQRLERKREKYADVMRMPLIIVSSWLKLTQHRVIQYELFSKKYIILIIWADL